MRITGKRSLEIIEFALSRLIDNGELSTEEFHEVDSLREKVRREQENE